MSSVAKSSFFSIKGDIAAVHRGTPLYGQPSWWGDGDADDENSFKQENKTSGKKQENSGAGKISQNPFLLTQKFFGQRTVVKRIKSLNCLLVNPEKKNSVKFGSD